MTFITIRKSYRYIFFL